MITTKLFRYLAKRVGRNLQASCIQKLSDSPSGIGEPETIFVVGCPRSGTTWFGRSFETLPHSFYLNEPRWFWTAFDPRCETYVPGELCDQAQLAIDPAEVTPREQQRAWAGLQHLLHVKRKRRIVEKSPNHTARIPWIDRLFPNAKFIHLMRNPHDVALSLETAFAEWFPDGWHGSPQWAVWDRHMHALGSHQAEHWHRTTNDYERALIIWDEMNRLAFQAAKHLGKHRYLRIHYERFANTPTSTINRILRFLGDDDDAHKAWGKRLVASFESTSVYKGQADSARILDWIPPERLEAYGYDAHSRLLPV